MNPFVESPLAVPQPGARWHRIRRRPGRSGTPRPPAGDPHAAGDDGLHTGGKEHAVAPGRSCVHSGARKPAARILHFALLAAALFVPGIASAIDLNSATSEQLQELKGIGPKMAKVIIEERGRGGRYASIDDLSDRVKGIGPKKAAALLASGLEVAASSQAKRASAGGGTGVSPGRRGR